MDDRYSMRAPLRPIGRGANPVAPPPADDDPLVELARIVSGRPAAAAEPAPRRRGASLADEPGMSEADLARDLEAELLSDLQASLAAVGEAHDHAPVDEDPTFTDEAYVTEQYRDDPVPEDEPYAFDPEPAADEPPPAGSLFVADQEPDDLRPYRPQPAPPAAAQGAEFDHLGMRGGKRAGGPAYYPRALIPEPAAPPPQPAARGRSVPVRPVAHEPFEAVARQTFDAPGAEPDFRGIDDFDDRARVEAPAFAEEEEDFRFAPIVAAEPPRRRRGRLGTVLMGLVAVGVAAAAYVYFRDGTATGAPPLILADTSPVRQVPENPTAPEPPNAIYARIDPTEGAAPVVLGAGAEVPVDPAANTPPADDGITTLIGGPAAGVDVADDRRVVRTVVLAPDGTIVNNLAGERGIEPAPLATPAGGATTPATPDPATAPATPAATTPPAAAADTTTTPPALAQTDVAPAPVAAAPAAGTPAATPAAGTGIAAGWYVQVSSQTTEAAARADIAAFRARAPSLLGSRNAVIPTATVAGVVRYRVQFGPAASQTEAQSLCNSLRAAGIDCWVANNP
ncbi:MAG: SPOR domain-containing protein [Bauldia sp.]|nr:SPOR domain-containing protein [Bauldia sp.]